MMSRAAAAFLLALSATAGAQSAAADLPPIKVSSSNAVPGCATPGRLMAFLKSRNSHIEARYDDLASEYLRHGEALAIRWDIAFFQMLVETGNLSYTGDVKPQQNNFAGLGATGGGERGESFKDISTGVRAHLEHLLLYAGEHVSNPVAERTRKVQEWGVLTKWHKTIKGPVTFTQMSRQWAPGARSYVRDITGTADAFFAGPCKERDPSPELLAAARGKERAADAQPASAAAPAAVASISGTSQPAAQPRQSPLKSKEQRSGLGTPTAGQTATASAGQQPETKAAESTNAAAPAITILNAAKSGTPADAGSDARENAERLAESDAAVQTASAADAASRGGAATATAPQAKCHVWTASYGGQKAIIIKATGDKSVDYTVLEVNEGKEKREADAYIAAYAKGGQTMGEFESQNKALDKAFELCPEG